MGAAKAFKCNRCWLVSLYAQVQCPSCRAFNSFVTSKAKPLEVAEESDDNEVDEQLSTEGPERAGDVEADTVLRYRTGIDAIDYVCGDDEESGIAHASCLMIAADPGVGKTRLMCQVGLRFAEMSERGKTLIATGEMTKARMRTTLETVGPWTPKSSRNTLIHRTGDFDSVVDFVESHKIKFALVDSVQYFESKMVPGSAGSISQVKYISARAAKLSADTGAVVALIFHVDKEGNFAGPKYAEHAIDVDIRLEMCEDYNTSKRVRIRAGKNRFGPSGNVAYMRMTKRGLIDCDPPSED